MISSVINRPYIKVPHFRTGLFIISLILLICSGRCWAGVEEQNKVLLNEETQTLAELYKQPEHLSTFESNSPDLFKAGTRMIAGLVVLVGVLLVLATIAKKFWGHGKMRLGNDITIRIVANRYLGSKNSLTVINVEGEHLLLGVSANGIRLLTRLKDGSNESHQNDKKSSFEKVLQGRINDH